MKKSVLIKLIQEIEEDLPVYLHDRESEEGEEDMCLSVEVKHKTSIHYRLPLRDDRIKEVPKRIVLYPS